MRPVPPNPTRIFSPSNSKTETGGYISSDKFIPSARCGSCHQETHSQWSESLHRNAGREPFYKASVNILEKKRGIEFIQHCESCHSPATMFTGALVTGSKETRVLDDEGVSCAVCHSITEANPLGTSSYTIRQPYLLFDETGRAIGNEATDKQILENISDHKRAVMNPVLKKPEFCGACHKSNAPPELNNYKFIRGYSTYDEWQQSGASRETVLPFYAKDKRLDCRSCHMPSTESAIDAATKDGKIKSHRWLGANTAVPLYYGHTKQAELTEKFLKDNVLSVDIFAIRRTATGELIAPLIQNTSNSVVLSVGEEIVTDVVIFNRGAAHSFPPELRDLYEPWVEFEAFEKTSGKKIFHSGFIKADGTLDEKAHVYKAVLLDELGKPFTRHQVWLGTAKAYDAFIPPGRSDLVRYRFRVPTDIPSTEIVLRAKVNYRRFIKEYADYVAGKFKEAMPNPTVEMAKSEACLIAVENLPKTNAAKAGREKNKKNVRLADEKEAREAVKLLARRWNDYGIGLLGQMQYGAASEAFRKASEVDPSDANLLVNAAIAELQTERYGPELTQLGKAKELLEKALATAPENNRAKYYFALVRRSEGATEEAAGILAKLALEYPNDREVQRQFGQTLYRLGRFDEARIAFLTINRIDPTDAGAYQFLSPLFAGSGLIKEAQEAQKNYLLWRDDPQSDVVANRFYAAHPEWSDVRVPGKIYSSESPERAEITGEDAAAER
ncbi:MAG: tetratricopeptide repeat protein [Pyrinomonadaceae bacterium]|nr:tetratricopeptide repeat protein [Pyrinomonadaceae bacterium]